MVGTFIEKAYQIITGLAARNILLPFILLPKIAGFGPTTKDETNNKDDTKVS
jgi:hypothetical protein